MIAGLALMFLGYWYQVAIPTSVIWTDEQAREYGSSAARLHSASFGAEHDHSQEHSHSGPDVKSKEYIEAKAAFDKSKGDLDRARSRQSWIKYGIILSGVFVAACGVLIVAFEKLKNDDQPKHRAKAHKHAPA